MIMDNNYHIFVVISTIIVYVFLSSRKNENKYETNTSIMYILYVPIVLYGGYYFFNSPSTKLESVESSLDSVPSVKNISISKLQVDNPVYYSDNLLSDPYPSSSNSLL